MKEIKLTQGMVAMVDDSDYDYLNQYSWYAFRAKKDKYYAARWNNSTKKGICMHRELLGITDSKVFADHKDGNPLNNQRHNIRVATRSQNSANRIRKKNGSSKFLGVSKYLNKWRVDASKNNKRIYCGVFKTETEAAIAYNKKATELHGEFARLNIISP